MENNRREVVNNNILTKARSWRTNLVGYVGMVIVLGSLVLVAIGKASLGEVGILYGAASIILSTINGFLSEDARPASKLLTEGELERGLRGVQGQDTLDPDKDEYPKTKF